MLVRGGEPGASAGLLSGEEARAEAKDRSGTGTCCVKTDLVDPLCSSFRMHGRFDSGSLAKDSDAMAVTLLAKVTRSGALAALRSYVA